MTDENQPDFRLVLKASEFPTVKYVQALDPCAEPRIGDVVYIRVGVVCKAAVVGCLVPIYKLMCYATPEALTEARERGLDALSVVGGKWDPYAVTMRIQELEHARREFAAASLVKERGEVRFRSAEAARLANGGVTVPTGSRDWIGREWTRFLRIARQGEGNHVAHRMEILDAQLTERHTNWAHAKAFDGYAPPRLTVVRRAKVYYPPA